jgi:DNA-directed RNA polymerase specialized sigma24 family protein
MFRPPLYDLDRIRHHSDWLDSRDQALMQMIFERGTTYEQIARLTGRNASTVSRRCRRLLRKLVARDLHALRGRDSDRLVLRIVQAYFLEGLPQRTIARKFNISDYRVRTVLRTVRSAVYSGSQTGSSETRNPPACCSRPAQPKGRFPCRY